MPEKNKSNEIRIIRIYDAPVQAVWDAWTDPDQTARWWGREVLPLRPIAKT